MVWGGFLRTRGAAVEGEEELAEWGNGCGVWGLFGSCYFRSSFSSSWTSIPSFSFFQSQVFASSNFTYLLKQLVGNWNVEFIRLHVLSITNKCTTFPCCFGICAYASDPNTQRWLIEGFLPLQISLGVFFGTLFLGLLFNTYSAHPTASP